MLGRTCSSIAIDMGTVTTRACQLVRRSGRIQLHRLRSITSHLHDPPDRAASRKLGTERARRIVNQAGFYGVTASIALSHSDVNFQMVSAPAEMFTATTSEWNTLLRFEAARQMQLEPDALELAAWPLPKQSGGPRVISAAVSTATVQSYRDQFAGFGLELARIDLSPVALLRAGWRAGVPGKPQHPAEALWGVLELGAHSSCLTIAVGTQCVFVRSLNIAGDAISQALTEACELSYAAAETIKQDPVVTVVEQAASEQEHPLALAEQITAICSTIRSKTRVLTSEVRRAFTFALENYADSMPVGLYLCGGSARLAGLAECMGESLGVDVQTLTPRKILGPLGCGPCSDPLLDDPAAAAVVGLALGDLV